MLEDAEIGMLTGIMPRKAVNADDVVVVNK
jgi:hypothetical protein